MPMLRRFRGKIVLISLLATLALVAASCQGAVSSTPSSDPASPSPAPTATVAPAPTAAEPPPAPPATVSPPVVVVASTADKSIPEIVELLSPSVVHIQTEAVQIDAFNRPIPAGGVDTGEIIDVKGYILTNNHVVEGAQRIIVTLRDDRVFEARIIGRDPATDLAVIQIDADNLVPIKFGRSSDLRIGDPVIAIGHALDLPGGPTVTGGLVSALERSIDISPTVTIRHLIQTDAAINPGNSGGPLVNIRGEMIGINTAKTPGADGIGFAIALDPSLALIDQLIENGRVERGFLGVSIANITEALAMNQGLAVDEGLLIVSVDPGSPANRAGLSEGDIIVSLAGVEINNLADLERVLLENLPGMTVEVEYFRGAGRESSEITLGARPG